MFSGPMFEPADTEYWSAQRCMECRHKKTGAHYNQFSLKGAELGIAALREMFPNGEANELNFALFSTSGVHGTYTTIEAIEESLREYPDGLSNEDDEWPENYCGRNPEVTFVIVHPRICCLRYGNAAVTLADIPFLKRLRETSALAVAKIGVPVRHPIESEK